MSEHSVLFEGCSGIKVCWHAKTFSLHVCGGWFAGSTDFITELAMDWNWDKIVALASYILNRCGAAAVGRVES